MAKRVYVAAKEDLLRQERRRSALARSGGDKVVLGTAEESARLRAAGATVAYVRVVVAHGRWYRSVLPMDWVHARGGIQ